MENLNFKVIALAIMVYSLWSCSPYKELLKDGERTVNDAIGNVIIDYYHTNHQEVKDYDVFAIEVRQTDNNAVYDIIVDYQYNKEILKPKDKIGSYSDRIPTRFKIYNNKLFIWNDSIQPINKEILDVLYKYDRLDSTFIKLELGLLDPESYDPPMFRIDEEAKSVNYTVCKKNIGKYKKLKTSDYIPPGSDKLPKVKCD